MPGGEMGRFVHSRQAIDAALAYLRGVDAGLADSLCGQLEPHLDRFCDAEYHTLTPRARNDFTAAISDLVSALERERVSLLAETSSITYWQAHHSAVVARQLDGLLRASPWAMQIGVQVAANSMSLSTQARDAAMAANLMWVLERERSDGRILVFAHNWHVKKARELRTAWPELFPGGPVPTMGEHLASLLGDDMIVIGTAFDRGSGACETPAGLPTSIDGILSRVGVPLYALDLRAAPDDPSAGRWLRSGGRMRIGNAPTDDAYCELSLGDAFDAVVHTDEVSAAKVVRVSRSV